MNENSKGKSRLFVLLIAAVIVGVAASILFKFGLILIPAYSFTLAAFVVVFDILFFIVMHPYINKNSVSGFYMMFAVLAASFSTFWGNNNLMNFFVYIFVFLGLVFQTELFIFGRSLDYTHMFYPFMIVGEAFRRGFGFFPKFVRTIRENSTPSHNFLKRLLIILLALVCSVPFCFLALALLSQADEIFKELLRNIKLEWIVRVITSIFCGVIAFYVFISFLFSYINKEKQLLDNKAEYQLKRIPSLFSFFFLIGLNVIYTIFTVIQCIFLFANELPQGVTYSEYTVSGFWQLIFLTGLNCILVLVSFLFTNIRSKISGVAMKVMNILLILNNAVMIFTAFIKLSRYENAYGYTVIRLLGYLMLIIFTILLVYILLKLITSKFPLRKCLIWTMLTLFVAFCFVNVPGVIAKRNCSRYINEGQDIDVSYITSFSYGVMPEIVELAKHYEQSGSLDSKQKSDAKLIADYFTNYNYDEKFKVDNRVTLRKLQDKDAFNGYNWQAFVEKFR